MMKSIFIHPGLVSSEPGVKVVPLRSPSATPRHPVALVFPAAVIWVGDGDRQRGWPRPAQGTVFLRPFGYGWLLIGSPRRCSGGPGRPTDPAGHHPLHIDTFLFSWVSARFVPHLFRHTRNPRVFLWFKGLIIPWNYAVDPV